MKSFYEEHTDKLFNLSHNAKMRVRVQILLLIYQILKNEPHSKLIDRLHKSLYSLLLDPSCLHSSVTELFLELLYNAFKGDHSTSRVMAGLKRLLQCAIHAEANVVVAVLIFVNKIAQNRSGLNQLLKNTLGNKFDGEEEGEEAHTHKEDENLEFDQGGYDFLKRDPLFAHADNTHIWELKYFLNHYHPSVKKISHELMGSLSSSKIQYAGNPLLDFTSASFLDRFNMKKPKTAKLDAKKKYIEGNKVSRSKLVEPYSLQDVMNSAGQEDVRDEEKFMFTYFKKKVDNLDYVQKLEKRKTQKVKAPENSDEEDAFADELFERELKKADKGEDLFDDEEDLEGEGDNINVDEFDDDINDDGSFIDEEDEEQEANKSNLKKRYQKVKKLAKKKLVKKVKKQ
jgi:hypothetical protein